MNFKFGQITAVNNCRTELTEKLEELGVEPEAMTGGFVEREKQNVVALDALAEISYFGECNDCVTVAVCRHVIDQVDDSIFQAAGIESVHHMDDQRTRVVCH